MRRNHQPICFYAFKMNESEFKEWKNATRGHFGQKMNKKMDKTLNISTSSSHLEYVGVNVTLFHGFWVQS